MYNIVKKKISLVGGGQSRLKACVYNIENDGAFTTLISRGKRHTQKTVAF